MEVKIKGQGQTEITIHDGVSAREHCAEGNSSETVAAIFADEWPESSGDYCAWVTLDKEGLRALVNAAKDILGDDVEMVCERHTPRTVWSPTSDTLCRLIREGGDLLQLSLEWQGVKCHVCGGVGFRLYR